MTVRSRTTRKAAVPCSPLSVVNCISKAWCVHYGQLQLDTLLLNVHCVLDDLHCLVDPLFEQEHVN